MEFLEEKCPYCSIVNKVEMDERSIIEIRRSSDKVFECWAYVFECGNCHHEVVLLWGVGSKDVVNRIGNSLITKRRENGFPTS